MSNSESKDNWYSNSTVEEKKNWYSKIADAYDRTRPGYPHQFIARAIELAQLPSGANILEIGCGPGTATTAFANLNFSVVGIEPSPESCQLARKNCSQYPNVEIINTTFEEWQLEPNKFDAVLAATSFHWVSPDVGYSKAANALRATGSLILLWNTPPQPDLELYLSVVSEVYQTYAPNLIAYEERDIHEANLSKFGETVIASGYFQDLVAEQLVREVTYSVDDYLLLLSTLSPYIQLQSSQRNDLFNALREVLQTNCGKSVTLSHLSVLQVAKRV